MPILASVADWLIGNAPYVGVGALGFMAGVVFAAWRQLEIEGE